MKHNIYMNKFQKLFALTDKTGYDGSFSDVAFFFY